MGFMLWCPTYEHNNSNTNPTQLHKHCLCLRQEVVVKKLNNSS